MDGYTKRTQQKKDAIIKASLELFNKKGYSKTNIKDIANKANVSQVSIYNYYNNKEALISACAKHILEDTIMQAKQILKSSNPFNIKLQQALSLCQTDAVISMEKNLSEVALNDSNFINKLKETLSEIKQTIFIEYIELGKSENVIPSYISNEIILNYIKCMDNITVDYDSFVDDCISIQHLLMYGLIGK